MLTELKNVAVQRADIEELVELSAFGRALETEFKEVGVETPDWLTIVLKSIRREIKSKNQDAIANRLRTARNRLETLKAPEEKRAALQTEIEQLEAQLKD